VGPFTEFFGDEGPNPITQSHYDMHHCYSNVIGDIVKLMTNSGNMQFTPKQIKREQQKLHRFTKKWKRGERPPWSASQPHIDKVNLYISTLAFPNGEPVLKPLGDWFKMAELIKLAGPRGRWLVSIMDMEEDYKEKFITALDLLGKIKQKVPPQVHSFYGV
jgi:hypothetical protein